MDSELFKKGIGIRKAVVGEEKIKIWRSLGFHLNMQSH